jgi:cell division septation protein DedD
MVDNSGATGAATQTGAVADNFHIQLAALKSEAEANKAWTRILAKHNDVLGALTVHIVRADLGSQGIYYRVQAGPFADKASAKAACDKLKSGGQQCLIKP